MDGISSLQGGHQVAQKFSMTTFPLNCEREMVFPSRSCTVISTEAIPFSGGPFSSPSFFPLQALKARHNSRLMQSRFFLFIFLHPLPFYFEFFRGPASQVFYLASFRAEGPEWVTFPFSFFTACGTFYLHVSYVK